MNKTIIAVLATAASWTTFAGLDIDLDLKAKPIKDMRGTANGIAMGVNGAMEAWLSHVNGNDDILFVSNKVETARIFRQAGLRVMRLQGMNSWFNNRSKRTKDGKYPLTNPKAAFDFYKANGIKVFVCLECPNQDAVANCVEIIKWIVDNGYKDQVVGVEMGNETYASRDYYKRAEFWPQVIDAAHKIWPKLSFGIVIGEYMENDPDIAQIAARMKSNESLHHGWTYDTGYFSAGELNRNTARFVEAMSNHLHKVDHIIYHGYGAETPYSCSYYGFQRFRNFIEAYPQLKGRKYWLTEVRLRSDEDNRCQRIFREALIMGHYSLMMVCQPEVDGFYHHNMCNLAGGLYISLGKSWNVQWADEGGEYPDFDAPFNRPHMEVGPQGAVYHIIGNAFRSNPLLWHHGTSKDMDTEDSFYTSSRVTDQVYAHRQGLKKGLGEKAPAVAGEVEWVALTSGNKSQLCLVMVNTRETAEKVKITVPGKQFAAPTYRIARIKDPKYIDCREVPGEAKLWEEIAYEDTQTGYANGGAYEAPAGDYDVLNVEVGPNSVQSVTVVMRNKPAKK